MSGRGLAALGGLVALASVAVTVPAEAPTPAKWTLELRGGPPPAGSTFGLRAVVRIDDGWRLYSLTQPPGGPVPTRVWLAEGQPWALAGPVEGPEPMKEFDPVFGMDVETYVGRVEFEFPVEHSGGPATAAVQVRVRYQMCNGELCLRPKTVGLELPVVSDNPGPAASEGATNR